jgi:hypothetical protein
MIYPSLEDHGFVLGNGEEYHARAPSTFYIPPREERENVQPGELVKLMFKYEDGMDAPGERMWVVVTERTDEGYYGILANTPALVELDENYRWGIEVPFKPEHIINLEDADDETREWMKNGPTKPWPHKS